MTLEMASADRTVSVTAERGMALGNWDITFESEAVPGTLAVFAGVLALNRLDISSAVMQRVAADRVRDTFTVHPLDGSRFSAEDAARLSEVATEVLRGRRDLEAALRAARIGADPANDCILTSVEMQTDSEITTGITVRTRDRLGLLHDIAATLTRFGLRTRAITVLTYGGKAHDSFRVVDHAGQPVTDASLLNALRLDLQAVCAA